MRTGAPGHWPLAHGPAAVLEEPQAATGAARIAETLRAAHELAAATSRAAVLANLAATASLSTRSSGDELAAGLAGLYGAQQALLLALSAETETAVVVGSTWAGAAGTEVSIAEMESLRSGCPAVCWCADDDGAGPDAVFRMVCEAGMLSAIQVVVGEAREPAGVICLGHADPAQPMPEAARELALAAQVLLPVFADAARPGTHQDREALQRKLEQTQKMESLGLMAGMVAHDFNNLLTAILGYTSLVKNSPRVDAQDRESLALVEDAAHRAADLTGRLLSFARGGLVRFGPLDLRAVVTDTLKLAQSAFRDRIAVTLELPDDAVPIEGDDGQLQQALINILLNARDAMPEGGDVLIRLTAGERAVLEIADNGPGMDDATLTRLFEPFFTTKPLGSGTGLGMSITYGIVRGHNGEITVEAAPGEGARFGISLPLLGRVPEAPFDLEHRYGDGDLVLVVDDDEMVRRATSATVAHLGYNVVEAAGGRTAIDLVRARPDRFAAVLLDLVMPEMTGAETFRELQALRPDLPVIICTGYAPDAHITPELRRKIAGLVLKPFSPQRLRDALAEVGARAAVGR